MSRLLFVLLAGCCLLAQPALAETPAAPAAAVHATDHGTTTDHGAAPADGHAEADYSNCDTAAHALDETRRLSNPLVAAIMLPRTGCPAFIDYAAVAAAEAAALAAPAPAPAKSGH
jgi:hypothetical protein